MSWMLILRIASAAIAYFGLGKMGWNGSDPTDVGGGISINPEMMKIILSGLAAFLPTLADRFVPGLGPILKRLLDTLVTPKTAEDAPAEIAVTRKVDPWREDMDAFKLLADRHSSDPEAQECLANLLKLVTNFHIRRQGVQVERIASK